MMVERRSYQVSLRMIASAAGVVSAVISLLAFVVGRAQAVSDLRSEMSRGYVTQDQYRHDQGALAQQLVRIESKIDKMLLKERGLFADSLIAEPDP